MLEKIRLKDDALPDAMDCRIRDVSPRDTSGGVSGMQMCSRLQRAVLLLAIGELDRFLFQDGDDIFAPYDLVRMMQFRPLLQIGSPLSIL
jgi:hypothetical protein